MLRSRFQSQLVGSYHENLILDLNRMLDDLPDSLPEN
jgi:hypothetical protein